MAHGRRELRTSTVLGGALIAALRPGTGLADDITDSDRVRAARRGHHVRPSMAVSN